jgi:aspartokinase/homoserine dehydrogenase 1
VIGHKFGGSSLANADRMARVVDILLARDEPQVIVISAMQGVTDALLNVVRQAAHRDEAWKAAALALEEKHLTTAHALLSEVAGPVVERLTHEFSLFRDVLKAQAAIGAISVDLLELVSGLGEVWSSLLIDAAIRRRGQPSRWLDAREVLVVEKGELGALVDWDATAKKLGPQSSVRTVVTGFVARTQDGRITTLGRNGSDYSGAIFAALFKAKELHLWSDVDGVLSADPRLVPDAVLIEQLSYREACELAYFGAKVIHPQTMAPAIERDIPIVARSTFNPSHPGTRISRAQDLHTPVKGVTTFSHLAILNIEGAGMLGVPGTAERTFYALKHAGVSVVMVSQGSSEHSISCVIREADGQAAHKAVREAFTREIAVGQITDVTLTAHLAALAVVGDGMAGTPGVAARLFQSLSRSNINVRLIAQGSSERNISVVVNEADAKRALRAVHSGFYLSAQTISVGVIGPGNVGQAFLRQLDAARERLQATSNIDFRMRGIISRSGMALSESHLSFSDIRGQLKQVADLTAFTQHVHSDHLPHAVIVDCSASDETANHYAGWLKRGIHVITPNKNAGAGPWSRYQDIKSQAAQFRYESTVGAGLPIINTLRDLIDTGDEIDVIEGVFSGTLAYLFNKFDGSTSFSALVRRAKELGYTEPDPRDDLSGLDVARKLVILSRENGDATSLEDIALESLVPPSLRGLPTSEFMARLEELDGPLTAKFESAHSENKVLRYVARLAKGHRPTVGLVALPQSHAFGHMQLTDNIVQFTTKRYQDNPLVVKGPGAGPEVTAAGVFADLLRVAASIGAKL